MQRTRIKKVQILQDKISESQITVDYIPQENRQRKKEASWRCYVHHDKKTASLSSAMLYFLS